MATAELTYVPAADYHADLAHVTNSRLKVFRYSRRKYEAMFVTRTIEPEATDTPLIVGGATHTLLLEPERVDREIVLIPPHVLSKSGSRAGGAWNDFELENAGKLLLKQTEFDAVRRMVDAVLSDRQVRQLIELPGEVERTVTWTDESTGIGCKCRPDKLIPGHRFIVDLKTCADPSRESFAKSVANYGYDGQQAWYSEGCKTVADDLEFLFVAVGKEPPHLVRVYQLDDEDVSAAHRENVAALAELKRCRDTGDYSDNDEGQIIPIALPKWARKTDWRN